MMITIARLSAMTRSRPQLRSSRRSGCAAPGATVVLISAFGSMSLLTSEHLILYHAPPPRATVTAYGVCPKLKNCQRRSVHQAVGVLAPSFEFVFLAASPTEASGPQA